MQDVQAAKLTGLNVVLVDDPDDDMCRYAKACLHERDEDAGEAGVLGTGLTESPLAIWSALPAAGDVPAAAHARESLEESWRAKGFGSAVDAYNQLGGDPMAVNDGGQGTGELGGKHWWSAW